ncbi:unnamed protein product [Spirodela intermedia]|uniref:Uncharacterized protein n=1 Tax=Spirodela intermedia TaxID=51605 RepID=A0A7I8JUS5_SPIIN|nr:unnamed protein product [Spirodela intermedia]CAA6673844.1 unnamed protein product [Spirodela intermedia]
MFHRICVRGRRGRVPDYFSLSHHLLLKNRSSSGCRLCCAGPWVRVAGSRPSGNPTVQDKVLLPGAIVRVECTSASRYYSLSCEIGEQELWQKEEKGLIGVLPVRDAGSGLSLGDYFYYFREEPIRWHNRGVAARALHLSRGVEKPNGKVTYSVVLEGVCRISVQKLSAAGTYCLGDVSHLDMTRPDIEKAEKDPDIMLLSHQFKAAALQLISVLEKKQKAIGRAKSLVETVPVHRLADIFVASFEISFEEQLSVLDCVDLKARILKATELVGRHLQSIRVAEKITQKVEGQLSKSQKEFLLRQQMRAIRDELGDGEDDEDDVVALERKVQTAGMPPNVSKQAQKELRRLQRMQPQQPGYNSSHAYLELLADLPWQKASEECVLNLEVAKERLDCEHYGLTKVKQRIIEYLAVHKLKPDAQGPVLCFVGPPGVGKTSLASSIATALNRKFVRISLGGVKDEADIRGHRRTYIGSMPGRLIEGLRRAGVHNPVILLDEIDKVGADISGDPASALLEVLDPQQNKAFTDHYLNVPFDLSKVIFVATANEAQPIPPPLLDRMEVIELAGYTPEEKLKIAMHHLVPGVLERHGLNSDLLKIPSFIRLTFLPVMILFFQEIVMLIIQHYTREAGVRNLERNLSAIARAVAVRVAEKEYGAQLCNNVQPVTSSFLNAHCGCGVELEMDDISMVDSRMIPNALKNNSKIVLDEVMLEKVLGPPKFDDRETAERVATPGVSVGLATAMAGKGHLHLTGQLGDVIKESAQIALTWVRARTTDPIDAGNINLLDGQDIHIHFPAGAVPKDGPSAGRKNVRADTAMTGEVSLRGLVLAVGGIKDKVLAAHRYGIKRVIIPERNLKDLVEVLFAKRIEDVLEQAFEGETHGSNSQGYEKRRNGQRDSSSSTFSGD